PQPTPSATAVAEQKSNTKPEQVRIQVLNATGQQGKAREAADQLAKEGVQATGLGNYAAPDARPAAASADRYAKAAATGGDYAAAVAKKLNPAPETEAGKVRPSTTEPYTPAVAPTPEQTSSGKKGPVLQLVIGTDFKGVKITKLSEDVERETITA